MGNGKSNAAMRSINARAGFRLHRRYIEYQVSREKLDHWREELLVNNVNRRSGS